MKHVDDSLDVAVSSSIQKQDDHTQNEIANDIVPSYKNGPSCASEGVGDHNPGLLFGVSREQIAVSEITNPEALRISPSLNPETNPSSAANVAGITPLGRASSTTTSLDLASVARSPPVRRKRKVLDIVADSSKRFAGPAQLQTLKGKKLVDTPHTNSPVRNSIQFKVPALPFSVAAKPVIAEPGHVGEHCSPTSSKEMQCDKPKRPKFTPLKPIASKPRVSFPSPGTNPGTTTQQAALTSHTQGIFDQFDVSSSVEGEDRMELPIITIPPTVSQRKRVKLLALTLKDVDEDSRTMCCLASRLLRYAVFVSAQFILCEEFPGRRTERVLSRAQDCFSNLWPYLLARRAEVSLLKSRYSKLFLSRYVPNPLSKRIWGNPDFGDEVSRALRLVLSRLWFCVSIYGDTGMGLLLEQIFSVRPVGRHKQIVRVEMLKEDGSKRVYFALEATGEAIGRQTSSSSSTDDAVDTQVRADWSRFLQGHVDGEMQNLWNTLHCANVEDYEKGVSKVWLRRVPNEGFLGEWKQRVATRYVLACLVANSISGKQKSHWQMSMEEAGVPSHNASTCRKSDDALQMFLSEHHHVESIHFTSISGREFHTAIASVQTTHREYFVLRDNGLQIGSEEEG
ncbi:hypothetical protein FS842_004980, partial [Serendipita sp. 407]